jgi:2-polyprenyl-3-methyl-5-hydroxy-6-metoxy-1,4-benzoquinol methylase
LQSRHVIDFVNAAVLAMPIATTNGERADAYSASRRERTAFDDANGSVQAIVDRMMGEGKPLRVLEAGCGSRSHIQLGRNTQIVGIDLSEEMLERNDQLNEKIRGDIQTYALERSSFDIIFCWDVLEHLRHPEWALQNFMHAVREGGIIVLGAPVANSLKGTITRFTPLWFHVWVFRYLLKNKVAGTKGHGPFPTFFKKAMSPSSIQRLAREQRMVVEQSTLYRDTMEVRLRQKHWILDLAFRILRPLLEILSLGNINPDVTDFVIVLRKPANGSLVAFAPGAMTRSA